MRLLLILACLLGLCACASAPASNGTNAVLALELYEADAFAETDDTCKLETVYRSAMRGEAFPSNCAAPHDKKFLAAYSEGKRVYLQEKKLGLLKKKLKHTKFDLNKIKHQTAEMEVELMSAQNSRHKRAVLTRQLQTLSAEERAKKKEFESIAEAYESAKAALIERRKYNAAVISASVQKSVPVRDASLDY